MANANPFEGRMAKAKKSRGAGDIDDARHALWDGIESVRRVLYDADGTDPALTLRAVHALTQATGAYAKLVQAVELEARVEALESAHHT